MRKEFFRTILSPVSSSASTPRTRVTAPPAAVPTKVHSHSARSPKSEMRHSVHAASGNALNSAPEAAATASRPSKTPPWGVGPEEDQNTQFSVKQDISPSRSWAFQQATKRSSMAARAWRSALVAAPSSTAVAAAVLSVISVTP